MRAGMRGVLEPTSDEGLKLPCGLFTACHVTVQKYEVPIHDLLYFRGRKRSV